MPIAPPDFSAARLLVAGDVMLDRYWYGATSRISPEAPVPVVKVGHDEARPGGAGNVALNLAALGTQVGLVGLVGTDAAADQLHDALVQQRVDSHLLRGPGHPTITKRRVISRHQQLLRLDFEEPFSAAQAAPLQAAFASALDTATAVILSDYAKGSLSGVTELIQLARAAGRPVVVDPKGQDFTRYRGATVLTPNLAEFEAIVGRCGSEDELLARGEALRKALALEALLITRSERGMSLLQAGHPPLHLPALAREVFDVTGAGDTVVAVLGAALACGCDLADATHLANVAGGIVVGKLGTATVSSAELQAALTHTVDEASGAVAAGQLIPLCARSRTAGERLTLAIGFTPEASAATLHALRQAAALGERLVWLLPPGSLQQAPVLAELRAVDWVCECPPTEQARLAATLHPQHLVHPAGVALPAGLLTALPDCSVHALSTPT